jgi:hypothetical protein
MLRFVAVPTVSMFSCGGWRRAGGARWGGRQWTTSSSCARTTACSCRTTPSRPPQRRRPLQRRLLQVPFHLNLLKFREIFKLQQWIPCFFSIKRRCILQKLCGGNRRIKSDIKLPYSNRAQYILWYKKAQLVNCNMSSLPLATEVVTLFSLTLHLYIFVLSSVIFRCIKCLFCKETDILNLPTFSASERFSCVWIFLLLIYNECTPFDFQFSEPAPVKWIQIWKQLNYVVIYHMHWQNCNGL